MRILGTDATFQPSHERWNVAPGAAPRIGRLMLRGARSRCRCMEIASATVGQPFHLKPMSSRAQARELGVNTRRLTSRSLASLGMTGAGQARPQDRAIARSL